MEKGCDEGVERGNGELNDGLHRGATVSVQL